MQRPVGVFGLVDGEGKRNCEDENKDTPAGTIPLSTPENHLVINCRVAQELGLTVSEGMLSQADKIIR